MTDQVPVEQYMSEVGRLCADDPQLSGLSAGILVAARMGLAGDSRSFARLLGIEHALVLREIERLAEVQRLAITRRDGRTMRCFYEAVRDADPASGTQT